MNIMSKLLRSEKSMLLGALLGGLSMVGAYNFWKPQGIRQNAPFINHPINEEFYKDGKKQIILGAGIIGMAQALKLLQKGHNVIVVDKGDEISTQCSAFNGNIYNPYYFLPLVCRDNLVSMIKSLFKDPRECTLKFNFNSFFEKNFIMWGINSLILSMTDVSIIDRSKSMFKMGQVMEQQLQEIKKLGLLDDQLQAIGQVGFFGKQEKRDQFAKMTEQFGLQYQNINSLEDLIDESKLPELNTKENHLLFSNFMNKSILLPSESNIDTKILSQCLLEYCKSKYPDNFRLLLKTNVTNFYHIEQQIIGIQTNQGTIMGSNFIICTGLQSKYLCSSLNIRLPILPARGWVLEGNIPKGCEHFLLNYYTIKAPNYSGTILNGKIRLCGCAEVCQEYYSDNPKNDWGTIQILNKFYQQTGIELKIEDLRIRDCCRPMTPDDVGIVSNIPNYTNVYLNTGHGSRGMSFCFGAAEIMNQIIENKQIYPEYDVRRFYFI